MGFCIIEMKLSVGPPGLWSPKRRPQSPGADGSRRARRTTHGCAAWAAGRGRPRLPAPSFRPRDKPRGGATGSCEILAWLEPVAIMADSLLLLRKRGSIRSTWMRARKARPQLILSRRPRCRLRTLLRWCGRRRLRRRLLQAQAAGADWREGGCLVSSVAAAGRTKTAAPSAAPRRTPDEVSAPSRLTNLPVRLLRPVGPGRALLLLPLEQVSRAGRVRRVERETWRRGPGGFRPGEDRVPSRGGGAEQRVTTKLMRKSRDLNNNDNDNRSHLLGA